MAGVTEMIEAIRDSAAAVVAKGEFSRVRALRFTAPGWDAAVWRRMGELGWIGLRVPEEMGGSGLGLREQGALLEELGRGLVPEPLVEGALAAAVLAAAGDEDLLGGVTGGEGFVPVGWQEAADGLEVPGTRGGVRRLAVLPQGVGPGLVTVLDGGRMGLMEAVVDGVEAVALQDGGRAGVWRPDVAGGRVVHGDIGAALAGALEDAAVGTSFYLLGVAEQAFGMTLDYLRAREQFGRKLGSFQALQHRAADLRIALTLTRASVEAAAEALDAGAEGVVRVRAVSRAKARAADTALLVTRAAVQLHGAIGYTDEYDVGLFLRRAMVLANRYGSARVHRGRFAG